MMIWSRPEATDSSTTYWMVGLSTSGSVSLGWALVAGRNRVPRPAAGKTALRTLIEGLLSGGAEGRPVLAVECRLDPPSQLGFGGQAPLGRHQHGEAEDDVTSAESNDTWDLRRVQRSPGLARPRLADLAEQLDGPVQGHVARDRHVHRGRHAAGAVRRELRELPVGDPAQRAGVRAERHDAQPDRLHGARAAAHLHHVTDVDQSLEEQEEAGDDVADERLGAEADGQAEHAGRDQDGQRSEERRVGKECRSRWSPYH